MFSNLPVRFVALLGAALLAGGGIALWMASDHGRADATARSPAAQAPEAPAGGLPDPAEAMLVPPPPAPAKSREEQRFARADKDDDGRITQAEYLQQRRRNFDRLDLNRDGRLGFEEYAASGIDKFRRADSDSNGQLAPTEFAATAPRPKNRQTASADACRCPPAQSAARSAAQSATLPDEGQPD
jgi:hypothetical protein